MKNGKKCERKGGDILSGSWEMTWGCFYKRKDAVLKGRLSKGTCAVF